MESLRTAKTIYILLAILLAVIAFLYLLFSLFGLFFGLTTLLLLLFLIIKRLSQFFLFPGSFKIWRYWWQSILEAELSCNFLAHLAEVKFALDLLQKSSNLIHLKKNSSQLRESLEVLNTLLNNYRNIPEAQMNAHQKSFQDKTTEVLKNLNETVLIFPQKSDSLLTALSSSGEYDWQNATFEDFPENLSLKSTIESFDCLEDFIHNMQKVKFPMKYLQEGLFTNLNLLRLILYSTTRCEQYWIPYENEQVDCIIMKSHETITDAPVIIFCNPNGGLYEYSVYQNFWLDFYLSHGIDFCMWNYRGYGRNKGKTTSRSMTTDIQAVYDFLVKVKMYNKIGVHGESIGGVSACFLASKNEVSFLFADRTFSSLHRLVQLRMSVPKEVFKCVTRWTDNTSQNFISANCYKVLSCDTRDEIIPEKASLKFGISLEYNCIEIDKDSLSELFEAISNVCKYISLFKGNESIDGHKNTYILVGKESEVIEDEAVSNVVFKIFKALEVDAGGVMLSEVQNKEDLLSWIRVIQTWGSFLPIGSSCVGKDKALQRVRSSIDLMSEVFRENEFVVNSNVIGLCRQARFLKNGLLKILKCLENFNRTSTEELTIRDDEGREIYHAGYLIPLNCGHSGRYSQEEREMVKYHLKQVKFIY